MNPNEKTGNRKCWHVRSEGGAKVVPGPFTKRDAIGHAENCRAIYGSRFYACLDGYHFVPCDGEAHSNPYIDHCNLCAPRWGVVMVPEQFPTHAAFRTHVQAVEEGRVTP